MPDINDYAPQSGRIIGEDGKIYNLVDLLKSTGGGGGDMLKEVYDTNDDGKVDAAETADSVPWGGVTGKPSTFPPSSHSHEIAQVNGLQATLNGKMNADAASAVTPIEDPAAATVEDVADKINELIAALQG